MKNGSLKITNVFESKHKKTHFIAGANNITVIRAAQLWFARIFYKVLIEGLQETQSQIRLRSC